jgi:hypothetical protein
MTNTKTDIIPFRAKDLKEVPNDDGRAALGKWYWVHEEEDGEPAKGADAKWLGCVTRVGTNFVEIKGPTDHGRGTRVTRVHFDNFWQWCEPVDGAEADEIIDGNIARYQEQTRGLMEEVRGLTARLGVTQRQALEDGTNPEAKALSIRSSEPVEKYKKDLVKAKEKTLPDLFEKIKTSNEMMATWMQVKLTPLEAEADSLKGTVGLVKDRIFSVELYAGLVEEAKLVREGTPAPNDAQVHLMQRRAYMDEECLVGYEHGGMDYKNIDDFERWLCKSANFGRLFPYPRTLLAFQVRRHDKKRETNLANFIQVMNEKKWDKTTFLYVRNGEQLWRVETEIEFEEHLFPDGNNKLFTSSKLWAKKSFLSKNIDDIITDEEHQGKIEEEEAHEEKLKHIPEKDHWRHQLDYFDTSDNYHPFTPDNVYYDDIMEILEKEKKKHNRLVLVMQGILDRSPMLTPHPPWQLWTPEGFSAAFKLIYDATRALSAGDKPDFEAYRARLNSYLVAGSVTVGQEEAWEIREAERYNRMRAEDSSSGHFHEYERYRPSGDPGPGALAVVTRYSKKNHSVTYDWVRAGRKYPHKEDVPATLTTGQENVLNVDAYKPGDFRIFFDDPRTRQEYLQWAPMLLEAEECHAGNRGVKPNQFLPAIPHGEYVPAEERPVDLKFVEKPKGPPIADKYVGKIVTFDFDMETKGGTKFKKGERAKINWYSRRLVSLTVEGTERSIRNVSIDHVTFVGPQP